jgi:hypothetical protein
VGDASIAVVVVVVVAVVVVAGVDAADRRFSTVDVVPVDDIM